jgi:uncharacterized protein (DUF427 family)
MTKRYRAIWNDAVLADSTDAVVVDGDAYFPIADLRTEYLRRGDFRTTGPVERTSDLLRRRCR